ncbi:30S ribosomal protein S9 [Christensenellaceae bacterium OttesenSCG-928-L17]|nr:30S ribosomal protein S9 [Christensenellaceae bacterium OttesenSCG-928-L17]
MATKEVTTKKPAAPTTKRSAGKYTYGLGRRKAATARARLYKGKGEITINDKPALEYLSDNKTLLAEITDPLGLTNKQKDYNITVRVSGGGLAGQVDAIKLAISKAITTEAPDLRPVLKKAGLMKRDPREKERKKYGLRSARKKEQFSKR